MKKYAPIFFATLLWVWPGIFIKYLGEHFSSYTQNFYRFLAAAAFLLILGLFQSRRILAEGFKSTRCLIMPAVFVLLAQITWVEGIMLTDPAFASFLRRSSIFFVIILSFLLFESERKIISSKYFITGTILCLSGVAGVIFGRGEGLDVNYNQGVLLVFLSAVFWAMFIVSIRRIAAGTHSLISTGIIFLLTLPVFFIGGVLKGDITAITDAGAFTNLMLFLSGILFVGIANTLQYKSIKMIGSSLTSNLVLATPFLTAAASYYIFDETLTPIQLLSGLILLAGCAFVMRVRV